jgi:hypothetical protein
MSTRCTRTSRQSSRLRVSSTLTPCIPQVFDRSILRQRLGAAICARQADGDGEKCMSCSDDLFASSHTESSLDSWRHGIHSVRETNPRVSVTRIEAAFGSSMLPLRYQAPRSTVSSVCLEKNARLGTRLPRRSPVVPQVSPPWSQEASTDRSISTRSRASKFVKAIVPSYAKLALHSPQWNGTAHDAVCAYVCMYGWMDVRMCVCVCVCAAGKAPAQGIVGENPVLLGQCTSR